jgi:hypothetical protein
MFENHRAVCKIIRLLAEKVEYRAKDGAVEIVFRTGGIRTRLRDGEKAAEVRQAD